MASFIFNAAVRHEAVGAIDYDTDVFYASLHTSAYTPDKDTHDFFNDVTNEVVGTGYTAGGQAIAASVGAVDTANDRVDITFASVNWPAATITARYQVIRKRRGGASSADELVAVVDFGADITSTAGTFTVGASTLRKSNP